MITFKNIDDTDRDNEVIHNDTIGLVEMQISASDYTCKIMETFFQY